MVDQVVILYGEIRCLSLLGLKRLIVFHYCKIKKQFQFVKVTLILKH